MKLTKLNKFNEYSLLNNSKATNMCKLIQANPSLIFDNRKMCKLYNLMYKNKLEVGKSGTILSRLFKKGLLLRTKTQLRNGYFYSLDNKRSLEELYDKHLLPYNLGNRKKLVSLIIKNKFEILSENVKLDAYLPTKSAFIDKYGVEYILSEKVMKFVSVNLGFLMCDGHIKKGLDQIHYFFNQRKDAESFKNDFLSIFDKERLSLKYRAYCFKVGICNKDLANLFNSLGVPAGNKVYKPFLIPNWIYNGNYNIKRLFLSTIYGNEGSKPQDNRWRIQFVLSKTKEHIPNLLEFLNQIRAMLNHFGIKTTHIQLRKQKRRAFSGRFYIKGKEDLTKFYKQIGFLYASEKQEVLEPLILNGNI